MLTDLVDGALARARGITGPWGAFLDSSLDRIADSAVFAGLIWWFARQGKPLMLGLTHLLPDRRQSRVVHPGAS